MVRHQALAGARHGVASAIIVAVLSATLLTLLHFVSPKAHARAATPVASTTGYGSGTLGPWQTHDKVISSAADIRRVVATDGTL